MINRKYSTIQYLIVLGLMLGLLSACGDEESTRTFAPETSGETQISTNTPFPTSTIPPLDRQPGENAVEADGSTAMFKQAGSAQVITSGVRDVTIVDVNTGKVRDLPVQRRPSVLPVSAPDGSACLVIDRSSGTVSVLLYRADGSLVAQWSPKKNRAAPQASPVAQSKQIETGDDIVWNQDSSKAVVAIAGVGVFVADNELKMREVHVGRLTAVTAVAWSRSGQSIAIGAWNNQQRAAVIITVGIQSLDSDGTRVFALPEGDGRYIRSLVWGSEQVGLVFALRAISSNFATPNDLYYLPRFGEPMRLLASAGIAAPAAMVDQVAMAGNGTTVAFSILIPGSAGLRFHSVWVTDALAPATTRANTAGLRRVNEIRWTKEGVSISGIRRAQDDGAAYQVAVVGRLSGSEPVEIATERSEPTPFASPQGSPVAATPATRPQPTSD